MICPECNGIGTAFFATFIPRNTTVRVSGITYDRLPANKREAKRKENNYCKAHVYTCECCEGSGEVSNEY